MHNKEEQDGAASESGSCIESIVRILSFVDLWRKNQINTGHKQCHKNVNFHFHNQ